MCLRGWVDVPVGGKLARTVACSASANTHIAAMGLFDVGDRISTRLTSASSAPRKNGSSHLSGGNVCCGSMADTLYVSGTRPLHPTQRTNAEASFKVCAGPIAEVRTPRAW